MDYIKMYLAQIESIEANLIPQVQTFIAECRKQYNDTNEIHFELIRRLLTARIQIKTGIRVEGEDFLLFKSTQPFIEAERNFVLGLFYFQSSSFLKGAASFATAGNIYNTLPDMNRKWLLSLYNEYIGLLNGGSLTSIEQEQRLQGIELISKKLNEDKILAMVLRQKAYFLYEKAFLSGALVAIQKSSQYFDRLGPKSDHHLAIFFEIVLLVNLKRADEAKVLWENTLGPFDQRVEYARDVARYLVYQTELNKEGTYSYLPDFWKKIILKDKVESINLVPVQENLSAMETKLVSILLNGRRTRDQLCELIWPEAISDISLLWNRLHRLVSRTRKNTHHEIIYHDGYYVIKTKKAL